MAYHYLWLSSNPDLADQLRRANEERSAAFYQAFARLWRRLAALKNVVAPVAGWLRRRVRERAALRELAALDDYSLKDIGVSRGEIQRIARSFGDGTEESRRPGGDRNTASTTAAPNVPAWLRGVFDGGRVVSPRHRQLAPDASYDQGPRSAHG